jgi:DNA-binding MarR family transcriptional regulator
MPRAAAAPTPEPGARRARPLQALRADEHDDIAAVEAALGIIARRINLSRVHERIVARAGVSGIDRASYWTLARLAEHAPLRLSELAHVLGLDLSTVSRQVAALERHELVERTTDPSDRRAAVVDLTAEGHRALEGLRSAARARLTDVMADWSDEERAELARALTRFNEAVERYGDRP